MLKNVHIKADEVDDLRDPESAVRKRITRCVDDRDELDRFRITYTGREDQGHEDIHCGPREVFAALETMLDEPGLTPTGVERITTEQKIS